MHFIKLGLVSNNVASTSMVSRIIIELSSDLIAYLIRSSSNLLRSKRQSSEKINLIMEEIKLLFGILN